MELILGHDSRQACPEQRRGRLPSMKSKFEARNPKFETNSNDQRRKFFETSTPRCLGHCTFSVGARKGLPHMCVSSLVMACGVNVEQPPNHLLVLSAVLSRLLEEVDAGFAQSDGYLTLSWLNASS